MHETGDDLAWLQELLDRSYEHAGEHLRSITTPPRRISATELSPLLDGIQIVDLATVTKNGKPRVGPVDGLFFQGRWYFSSSKSSIRYRNLVARRDVSVAHTRGEEISVVVHGTAHLFSIHDSEQSSFREYAYEVYVPRYGEAWKKFVSDPDIFYARVDPDLMFTFRMDEPELP